MSEPSSESLSRARRLRGHFYFKLTESGNQLGEFGNNLLPYNQTECADRRDEQRSGFAGNYISVWHEQQQGNKGATLADLKIEAQPGANNVYTLKWQVVNPGSEVYQGHAMVADGMLIGSYEKTS